MEGAYITLNQDRTFIAERRTGPDGLYEFAATAGDWLLICRLPGADAVERNVTLSDGTLEADFDL